MSSTRLTGVAIVAVAAVGYGISRGFRKSNGTGSDTNDRPFKLQQTQFMCKDPIEHGGQLHESKFNQYAKQIQQQQYHDYSQYVARN